MSRIAIIGAGLSGLVAAGRLRAVAEVVVLEKSRGVGGRMATRYADPFRFDHGAQFFTARNGPFRRFLEPLVTAGVVARWDARFVDIDRNECVSQRTWGPGYPHHVGVPGMNAVGQHLAKGLDVHLHTEIGRIERDGATWAMRTSDGRRFDGFDWIILALPAAQAAELAPPGFAHATALGEVRMRGCFALMLGFEHAPLLAWDAAHVRDSDLSWVSVNSSKPGRSAHPALVVHSSNAYAEANLDLDAEAVRQHMLDELHAVTGIDASSAGFSALHRWRYANIDRQQGDPLLLDPQMRIACCGDWCIRGRVESAFRSGAATADAVASLL